ncbi:MAG: hypothetical protein LRY73_14970 [Bacillus sp. (in: Bacteria)]|nr:hypothetical protein [Bacillus sp. (in: firmicutes)]
MDNHLVQLIEKRILTMEDKIRNRVAKRSKKVKDIPRKRIPFDKYEDPVEKLMEELEQFDVDKEIAILEQKRMDAISDNRNQFFQPVTKALGLTKEAVALKEVDAEAAIDTFIEAFESFPSWNKDLVFNAIKAIYELGIGKKQFGIFINSPEKT